jgi:hypothetical protein
MKIVLSLICMQYFGSINKMNLKITNFLLNFLWVRQDLDLGTVVREFLYTVVPKCFTRSTNCTIKYIQKCTYVTSQLPPPPSHTY